MQLFTKTNVKPLLLLLLGSVSILFGALQVTLISQGPEGAVQDMASPAYFSMPVPILTHIIFGTLFNLLMPLQFMPQIRAKKPAFHRLLGRFLILFALGFGFSALWMNQFYPQYGGLMKYMGIVSHVVVMLGALTLALVAIRRRNIATHRIWMMRLTAAALSPATQRLVAVPAFLLFGESVLTDAVIAGFIWFGLVANLLFVEWILRKETRSVSLNRAF